jgi:4-alpha-glucanotransferase
MRSKAKTCIIPMQDYLGLDNKFRMNKPSSVGCNWRWRVTEKQLSEQLKNDILLTTKTFGRFNWS